MVSGGAAFFAARGGGVSGIDSTGAGVATVVGLGASASTTGGIVAVIAAGDGELDGALACASTLGSGPRGVSTVCWRTVGAGSGAVGLATTGPETPPAADDFDPALDRVLRRDRSTLLRVDTPSAARKLLGRVLLEDGRWRDA